jgi:hypothetical protein
MPFLKMCSELLMTATNCSRLIHRIHPSLHFKKMGNKYWSVRAGLSYRSLGVEVETGISWFWIGTHAEYDKLIGKL